LGKPKQTPHVFLFVNASSGGSSGADLLSSNVGELTWKGSPGCPALHAHIVNIRSKADRLAGFERVRTLVRGTRSVSAAAESDLELDATGAVIGCAPPPVYVVGCGGDGTIKWVMSELAERGLADVCIAAVPFGTGNDLSRVLGWGGGQPSPSLTGSLFADLRAHTRLVAKAQPTLFDIWEVTMSAAPSAEGGGFFNVRDGVEAALNQGRTSALAESLGAGGAAGGAAGGDQVHVELMMNYFSIGADAAMCFDFERNRPKGSAALNKLVYAIEGGKQQVLAYKYPPIVEVCASIVAGAGAADCELEEGGGAEVATPLELSPLKQKDAKFAVFLNIPSCVTSRRVAPAPAPPGSRRPGALRRAAARCASVVASSHAAGRPGRPPPRCGAPPRIVTA
jgi:hypothetical protein